MNASVTEATVTAERRSVCVAGQVFLDVVMAGLSHAPVPGEEQWVSQCELMPGGSANQAIACARLGMPVSLVSYLGTDQAGAMVRETLLREGLLLSSSVDIPRQSVTTSLFFDGDRAMTTYGLDAVPSLEAVPMPEVLIADLSVIATNIDTVGQWRSSAEPTWVLADVGWDDSGTWDPAVLATLSAVDLFAPNEVEAKLYTGTDDPVVAATALAQRVPQVVVTCGSRGAVGIVDGALIELPAVRVDVVDTTGAGDTFSAGLTWAHKQGLPPRASLSAASIAAAVTLERPGGSASAPTLTELAEWVRARQEDIPEEFDLGFLDLIQH